MKRAATGENGMAMVIALIALFLMSILGVMAYTTSDSEIQGAKNYKVMNISLYAAESGVEYSRSDPAIYSAVGTGSVNIPMGGVSLESNGADAAGTVEYLSRGGLPQSSTQTTSR